MSLCMSVSSEDEILHISGASFSSAPYSLEIVVRPYFYNGVTVLRKRILF